MAPGRAAAIVAPLDGRIPVELVIPDDVIERAVIDRIEGGSHGIGHTATETPAAFLECRFFVARENELLTGRIVLNDASEWTGLKPFSVPAAGKGLGIELEDEPPIYRVIPTEQRGRCRGSVVGKGRSDTPVADRE